MLISAGFGRWAYSGSECRCVQLFPTIRPEGSWDQRHSSLIAEARAGLWVRQKAESGREVSDWDGGGEGRVASGLLVPGVGWAGSVRLCARGGR